MRPLNISITKARIKSFDVEFREEREPIVTVNIQLLTENDEPITTYNISTYYGNNKFEIPVNLTEPILKMLGEFERVAAEHCNNRMKLSS